jgi:hypothetical protein
MLSLFWKIVPANWQ